MNDFLHQTAALSALDPLVLIGIIMSIPPTFFKVNLKEFHILFTILTNDHLKVNRNVKKYIAVVSINLVFEPLNIVAVTESTDVFAFFDAKNPYSAPLRIFGGSRELDDSPVCTTFDCCFNHYWRSQ